MSKLFSPKEELQMFIKDLAGRTWTARDRVARYEKKVQDTADYHDKAFYRRSVDHAKDEHELLTEVLKEATETFRRSYDRR